MKHKSKNASVTSKMESHGFTDLKEAESILWISEGYGYTDTERVFRAEYKKATRA